jgi:hypothetical protein
MAFNLTAVLIRDGIRYERDLAPHYMHVEFNRVFPPRRETVQAVEAWAHRTQVDPPKAERN